LERFERNEHDGVPATGDVTDYHYGQGFGVTNETYSASLPLTEKSYVGGMAEYANDGTSVAERHYTQDHLGSTRGMYDELGSYMGGAEYTPYGMTLFNNMPADTTRGFTGHHLDHRSGQYFAPFRYYDPTTARWLKRDPLGMIDGPNMYGYVGGNPILYSDPLGLYGVVITTKGVLEPLGPDGTPARAFTESLVTDLVVESALAGGVAIATGGLGILARGGLGLLGKGVKGLARICGIGEKAKPVAKALGADALPSLKNLKKLSKKEVKNLDVHSNLMKGFNSRQDLYKDAKGNIFVGNKGGGGFGDPLYINIYE